MIQTSSSQFSVREKRLNSCLITSEVFFMKYSTISSWAGSNSVGSLLNLDFCRKESSTFISALSLPPFCLLKLFMILFIFLKFLSGLRLDQWARRSLSLFLWLMLVLSLCWARWITCCWMGMKCSLGQLNLVCRELQNWQTNTSNQSRVVLLRSRRQQQCRQSIWDSFSMLMSWSKGMKYITEYSVDLISQLGRMREMNYRPSRLGFSWESTFIRSMIMMSLYLQLRRLVTYPIYPCLRINRLQSSSMRLRVCSGWLMSISIFSANETSVLSTRFPKKVRSWKMLRLLSCRQSLRRLGGSVLMKAFSSQRLNFLRMLTLSSMQLLMRHSRSSGSSYLSESCLNIFMLRLFSRSCVRMLLMRVPSQLMLQARQMTLTISMKTRQMAYWQVEAVMSPKPTVSMMLVPQQQAQTQRSNHQLLRMPLRVCQLQLGSMLEMEVSSMARMCAKQKLNRNTLISDQYCSLQQFLMKKTYSFSILSRHWGNLARMKSRTYFMAKKLEFTSITIISRLTMSIGMLVYQQFERICERVDNFLPLAVFTVAQ